MFFEKSMPSLTGEELPISSPEKTIPVQEIQSTPKEEWIENLLQIPMTAHVEGDDAEVENVKKEIESSIQRDFEEEKIQEATD